MSIRRAVLVVLLAGLGLGSTCDNQDLSGRFVLSLDAGEQEALSAYAQPYIGRLTMDFGLWNTGDVDGEFGISVQAQTSGAEDAAACENGLSSSPRLLAAVAADSDAIPDGSVEVPTLRSQDRTHFVTLPSGQDEGVVNVRIRTTGSYRVYVSAASDAVELLTLDGTPIEASATTGTGTCDLFSTVIDYALTDGTYRLRVREDGLSLLLEEACESVRTVPRTCPGAVSDVFARDPIQLAPGGFISGRIASTNLGVGNQVVVSVRCSDTTPDCAAELEAFFLVQQLECRRDTDCSNVAACTEDGYCRKVRNRGCASRGGAAGGAGLLLVLAALLVRRRA